jgi:uncharacterized protein (TIGR03435 family)
LPPRQAIAAGRNIGTKIDGARVDIGLASLTRLIMMAYRAELYQISGPDWMAAEHFDVLAKMPDGASRKRVPEMLQALLEDRFKLVVRRESKEQTVYALLVDKDGPKLKQAEPGLDPPDKPFRNGPGDRLLLLSMITEDGYRLNYSRSKGRTIFEAERITMGDLAIQMMHYVDAPVVDMTGLKGAYQIAMDVPGSPNAARAAARSGVGRAGADATNPEAPPEPSGASIFASVQKLGLRLEKRKAPIESIAVERLEKAPTEN